MKKYLVDKMMTKISKADPAELRGLLDKVYTSSPQAQALLSAVLEQVVFPWYTNVTGRVNDAKKVRDAIAQRIEKDLSAIEWTLNGDKKSPKYRIVRAFPEYIGAAEYVISILLAPAEDSANVMKINMATLLLNFSPVGVVSFNDYDS